MVAELCISSLFNITVKIKITGLLTRIYLPFLQFEFISEFFNTGPCLYRSVGPFFSNK